MKLKILNKIFKKAKADYLEAFDESKNGPLHELPWVKEEMKKFNQSIDELKLVRCNICCELWPSLTDYCSNCTKQPIRYSKVKN